MKCDPDLPGEHKCTPLHMAANKGHLPIVKFLLEEGNSNPLSLDEDGNTPLHHASMEGSFEVLKFLTLTTDFSPTVHINNDGDFPIHFASQEGRPFGDG